MAWERVFGAYDVENALRNYLLLTPSCIIIEALLSVAEFLPKIFDIYEVTSLKDSKSNESSFEGSSLDEMEDNGIFQPYAISATHLMPSVTHSPDGSCATFLFLQHFDIIWDLLLNRCTATWNLFVNYSF